MIPTMLVVGLAVGRRWAIPAAGVVWALVIAVTTATDAGDVGVAALLGAANAAVGVLARQAIHRVRATVARRVARLTA